MADKTKLFDDLRQFGIEDIDSFKLRKIDGHDEIVASERAGDSGNFSFELLSQAIVEVNGEAVVSPYVGWKSWDSVTLDFVRTANRQFNNARKDKLEDFLQAFFGKEV